MTMRRHSFWVCFGSRGGWLMPTTSSVLMPGYLAGANGWERSPLPAHTLGGGVDFTYSSRS
jgi:hypothetical protein